MIDHALHRWIAENTAKLTPSIKAKIRINFPTITEGAVISEPSTNYVETAREIRNWVNRTYPDTLEWEYDL